MKLSWRKDETFKMTLQYDNTDALWTGLELYGNLLVGILIVGLILTTFIPAMGKIIVQSQVSIITYFQSSIGDYEV